MGAQDNTVENKEQTINMLKEMYSELNRLRNEIYEIEVKHDITFGEDEVKKLCEKSFLILENDRPINLGELVETNFYSTLVQLIEMSFAGKISMQLVGKYTPYLLMQIVSQVMAIRMVNVLASALKEDYAAVSTLLNFRVPFNSDPNSSCPVFINTAGTPENFYTCLGLLGTLNGMLVNTQAGDMAIPKIILEAIYTQSDVNGEEYEGLVAFGLKTATISNGNSPQQQLPQEKTVDDAIN